MSMQEGLVNYRHLANTVENHLAAEIETNSEVAKIKIRKSNRQWGCLIDGEKFLRMRFSVWSKHTLWKTRRLAGFAA